MHKLWIVLVTCMHRTNWAETKRTPIIHGVYGSEEEMLKHPRETHLTPRRWFDTDIYVWGSEEHTLFWGLPFDAEAQQLKIALGQQWFKPTIKEPESQQNVMVFSTSAAAPVQSVYLGDGVFQLEGVSFPEVRADSVVAWRPLPAQGEAWPTLPPAHQIKTF